MATPPAPRPRLLLALALVLAALPARAKRFADVSLQAGLDHSMGPRKKFGGPLVADLNSDGFPDLIFCHHDRWFLEVYLNDGNGKFVKQDFPYWWDSHGQAAFRPTAFSNNMRFTNSPGGSAGTKPANPEMFEYQYHTGAIVDVTEQAGVEKAGGRGRNALFLPLKGQDFRPDVVFTNAEVIPGFEPQQFGYQNLGRGKFKLKTLKGFSNNTNQWITVTDIDNDGRMEILSYLDLKFYKITSPFTFTDITARVLPPDVDPLGAIAVAEIDFDNDGDMDLYIARTNTGSQKWIPQVTHDYLLENRDGVYVDVTKGSGIPQEVQTRAITVGDFDNDGWMDLYITRYWDDDILMLNNRDGSFRPLYSRIPRPSNVRGDSATAVDYDGDGRVDLVVGQGDRDEEQHGGFYRIFKSTLSLNRKRRFVLVRVGNAPSRGATSLYALVTVTDGNGFKAIRRVGTPGVAVSNSYIELVHVGIGFRRKVTIEVRWTNGELVTRRGVKHGSKITIGQVPG